MDNLSFSLSFPRPSTFRQLNNAFPVGRFECFEGISINQASPARYLAEPFGMDTFSGLNPEPTRILHRRRWISPATLAILSASPP